MGRPIITYVTENLINPFCSANGICGHRPLMPLSQKSNDERGKLASHEVRQLQEVLIMNIKQNIKQSVYRMQMFHLQKRRAYLLRHMDYVLEGF